jgi:hypothetical protein
MEYNGDGKDRNNIDRPILIGQFLGNLVLVACLVDSLTLKVKTILWHVDPLLDNVRETNSETTARKEQLRKGAFCAVLVEML